MTRSNPLPASPTLAETVFATRTKPAPTQRLLTSMTALAAAITLVLATAIPVSADRTAAACTLVLAAEQPSATCSQH